MIEDLRKNINTEIEMVRELANFVERSEHAGLDDRRVFLDMINSLAKRIKFANNSVPEVLKNISLTKKLPAAEKKESVIHKIPVYGSGEEILLKKEDKEDFFRELNISENLIRRLKKRRLIGEEKSEEFKKTNFFGKTSNRFFFNTADKWVSRGNFKNLSLNLRRGNMNILTTTYVSMMLFSILLSFIIGILTVTFFMFFNLSFSFSFITVYEGGYILRFLKIFWIAFALPLVAGLSFYFFPGAEKKALASKIDQELPFVVIHMSSISGSGIGPGEIFKIIGLSKEYKYTRKEIIKILNQTNIYGYDLTNALRNVALATPSPKLAELLNGISTTIHSGGDISVFFEKRAESLLLEYRLEREKFTKTAETFMDIYISIVIAAPMILLMLLIMISVSGIQTGFGINQMTIAIIGIVAIINILFLTFLQLKSPTY